MSPVSPEQGKQVAKRMNAKYAECSSKKMEGVHEVFDLAMDIAIGVPGAAPASAEGDGHTRTGSVSAGGSGGVSASGRPMGPETKRRKKKGCVIL